MAAINLTPFFVGSFFLAYYVWMARASIKKIPSSFWFLSISITVWLFFLAFRGLLPNDWRGMALNWTLIPAILIPHFLFLVVKSVLDLKKNYRALRVFDWAAIIFFLFEALIGGIVKVKDPNFFSYTPNPSYHLLIFYIFCSVGFSICLMGRGAIKSRGQIRTQLILMLMGIFVGLFVSIIFVYILPLMGVFMAYLSSFGMGIYITLWSIAILQYDIFEIKLQLLSGTKVPLLIRLSSPFVLFLYHIVDPTDYDRKLLEVKAKIANSLIEFNYELVVRTSLEGDEKSRVIAAQFSRYLK